jgi:type VI protein secretion system component Hcp
LPIYVNFGEPISGHCEAATLSFGMQVKRLAGGAAHSAQAGDVSFTKETDSLSHGLFLNSTKASKPLTVTIEVWKKTAKAPTLIYTLKNANIFLYRVYEQGGMESVSLVSESISHQYFPDERPAPPVR